MGVQLLIESLIVDCANDVKRRDDLFESLEDGQIKTDIFVEKNGKLEKKTAQFEVLGVYDVPISRPGIKNKNNRTYTLERSWNPVLEKKLGEGSIGLLNHPKQGESPDVTKACCVWRNHRVVEDAEGNPNVRADMYLLRDKKGNGDLVEAIIKAGGKVDLSTRGYGEIDPQGVVYNYDYKATDVVYEGSYGVRASKDDRYSEDPIPETTEQTKDVEKGSIIESGSTNNKSAGEGPMINKLLAKRMIKESLGRNNKFRTYTELKDLSEMIKDDESLKDEYKLIQEKLTGIEPTLEAEYQGDSKDTGSAGNVKTRKMNATDPEKKIKDTDEKEPDDIKSIQVEPVKDTPESERKGKTGIKAGSAPNAMKSEVKNGEVSSVNQGLKANEEAEVDEDTDEQEPDDVNPVQVDAVADTKTRSAYTNKKAGGGGDAEKKNKAKGEQEIEKMEDVEDAEEEIDLNELSKEELMDVVKNLNTATQELQQKFEHEQACFDTLSEQYLKMETWAGQAESVVEMDKDRKEKAQGEVSEAVEYVETVQKEYSELIDRVKEQQKYIGELEEIVHNTLSEEDDREKVLPYVTEVLRINPQLIPFEAELKKASSIHEAREMIAKYSSMSGKIRIDEVLTTDEARDDHERVKSQTAGRAMLESRNWL